MVCRACLGFRTSFVSPAVLTRNRLQRILSFIAPASNRNEVAQILLGQILLGQVLLGEVLFAFLKESFKWS